jgi:membrane protein
MGNTMNASTKNFINKVYNDDLFKESAALSYYTVVSLAPLIILTVWSFSFFSDSYQEEFVSQVRNLIGNSGSAAIELIIKNSKMNPTSRGWTGMIGILTLLVSASVIFSQLETSLSRVFFINQAREDSEKPERKSGFVTSILAWVKQKTWNVGVVLGFIFLCIVSMFFSTILEVILPKNTAGIGELLNFIASLAAFSFVFKLIYHFLPKHKNPDVNARHVNWKLSMTCGFCTAILFSIGKKLIEIYLTRTAVASSYGAASSVVLLLIWIFYSSLIILLSAELGLFFEPHLGSFHWRRDKIARAAHQ